MVRASMVISHGSNGGLICRHVNPTGLLMCVPGRRALAASCWAAAGTMSPSLPRAPNDGNKMTRNLSCLPATGKRLRRCGTVCGPPGGSGKKGLSPLLARRLGARVLAVYGDRCHRADMSSPGTASAPPIRQTGQRVQFRPPLARCRYWACRRACPSMSILNIFCAFAAWSVAPATGGGGLAAAAPVVWTHHADLHAPRRLLALGVRRLEPG